MKKFVDFGAFIFSFLVLMSPGYAPTVDSALKASNWTTANFNNARTGNNVDEHTLLPPLESLWVQQFDNYFIDNLSVKDNFVAITGMFIASDEDYLNQIRMLDIDTREILWTFDLNAGGGGSMSITPVLGDDQVYFGGQSDDKLYALELATGQLIWERTGFAPSGVYSSEIALIDNRLFIPNDIESVTIFDAQTGDLLQGNLAGVWGLPLAIGHDLVFGLRANESILTASHIDTGEVVWELDGFEDIFHWIIVSETHVYVRISQTDVAAVDIQTGEIVWRTSLPAADLADRGAVLSEKYLFVPVWLNENNQGSIIALDIASGRQVWEFTQVQ